MSVTPVDLGVVLVPLVGVLAAIAARALRPVARVHVVVFELLLGMLLGPDLLGWLQPTTLVRTIAEFGVVMLFFVAGTHIELDALRGRSGRLGAIGWLISLAAGLVVALLVVPGPAVGYVAVALASTAFGALMPILRDAGELGTPFGRAVAGVGAAGEFGPLLVISVFLGGRSPVTAAILLGVFAVVAAVAVRLAALAPTSTLHRMVRSTLHDSQQFAVRALLLVVGALVALSLVLRLDVLLGAFIAGVVWRLLMREAPKADRKAVESKVEGVADGFLIPVFFVATGVTFDLRSFVEQPLLLLLVPAAAVALLVVRGLPAILAAPPGATGRDRASLALLGDRAADRRRRDRGRRRSRGAVDEPRLGPRRRRHALAARVPARRVGAAAGRQPGGARGPDAPMIRPPGGAHRAAWPGAPPRHRSVTRCQPRLPDRTGPQRTPAPAPTCARRRGSADDRRIRLVAISPSAWRGPGGGAGLPASAARIHRIVSRSRRYVPRLHWGFPIGFLRGST